MATHVRPPKTHLKSSDQSPIGLWLKSSINFKVSVQVIVGSANILQINKARMPLILILQIDTASAGSTGVNMWS